uniref:Uncharacterized protein n=1 Tax=Pararge aegeria TaxID=116150 RepID=S4NL59_9NEOP
MSSSGLQSVDVMIMIEGSPSIARWVVLSYKSSIPPCSPCLRLKWCPVSYPLKPSSKFCEPKFRIVLIYAEP